MLRRYDMRQMLVNIVWIVGRCGQTKPPNILWKKGFYNILYVSNRVKIYELLVHLLILNGECRVAVISWLLSWHPAIWQSLCCSSRTWASSVHTRASNETQWFDLKVEHPNSSPINGLQSDRPHRLYSSWKYRGKKGYEKYDISVLWMYICTYEAYLLWYSFVGHVYCYQEILRMFSIVWICVTSGSLWNIKNDALFVWYRSHISDTHFSLYIFVSVCFAGERAYGCLHVQGGKVSEGEIDRKVVKGRDREGAVWGKTETEI